MPHLVHLSEDFLAQPDAHRRVSRLQELHLLPAYRDSPLGFAAIHDFGEFPDLTPALDRTRGDGKPGGDLVIRALHSTEAFQFDQVDFPCCSALRPMVSHRLCSTAASTPVEKSLARAAAYSEAPSDHLRVPV